MRRFQYAVSGTWLKSMQISPTFTVSTRVICTQSGSSWFFGKVNTRHYLFDVLPLKRHTSWVCFYHPEGVTVYLRWQFTTWYYRSSKCMWFASRVWQFGVLITLLTLFGVLAVFFSSPGHVCHSIQWVVILPHITWGFNFSFVSGFLVGLKTSAS